jgi:hypothetical protein
VGIIPQGFDLKGKIMEELFLKQETIDFLAKIELPDMLENCGLEDPIFENIADLLGLLWQSYSGKVNEIRLHLPDNLLQ